MSSSEDVLMYGRYSRTTSTSMMMLLLIMKMMMMVMLMAVGMDRHVAVAAAVVVVDEMALEYGLVRDSRSLRSRAATTSCWQ